jgi:hypothetical protein
MGRSRITAHPPACACPARGAAHGVAAAARLSVADSRHQRTGAAADDTAVAAGLLRIVRVLRLQGVAAALSGVGPALAQAIVGAGIDLSEVPCYRSVEHALA